MSPKISVAMSVFDGEEYLRESIESILSQSFEDFEFIIANDCSNDSTSDILHDYEKQDKRIKLIKNLDNIGLTKSLNKILRFCKGKFIARIDADDISYKERLKKQIEFMTRNENCQMAATLCDIISENSINYVHYPPLSDTSLKWSMIFTNPIRHSTTMWRNKKYFYDEKYEFAQDYEMWIRMGKILIIPEVLGAVRSHDESISSKKTKEQDDCLTEMVKQNIEKYLEKKILIEDAKILRYIFIHKHYLQIQEMELIEIKNFKRYISMYFELVSNFIKKEEPDKVVLENEITNDLANLINLAKNKEKWTEFILIELHKVFKKSNEKIIKKITNNIIKIEKKLF
jgi:glycosyltransferase involved in cell wall biosynthesis